MYSPPPNGIIRKADPLRYTETRQPLTERQHEVLTFVAAYIDSEGFPPSLRDICKRFEMTSTNAARDHLLALERKGYVKRPHVAKRTARSIKVIHPVPAFACEGSA